MNCVKSAPAFADPLEVPADRPTTSDSDPILTLDHVSRTFDSARIVGVDDVTLRIRRRDIAALFGPSGSGKSTLLNLMSGLDAPTRGSVTFDGHASPSPAQWTRFRGERIGLVFQDFNLLPTLTASENVEVAIFGRVSPAAERRRRALAHLAEVGLEHAAGRRPQELSGGERRRVGIARALVNEPELLLADEPTGNLDSASGAAVANLLLKLHESRRMTLVIVTHDASLIARCARRIHLVDGRIVDDSQHAGTIAA